jgi:hypothetical protein
LPPLSINLGGANITISSTYSHKHYYVSIHSFFFSTQSLYWDKV